MKEVDSFFPVVKSLFIGLIGALLFSLIHTPLPWLLGAIVAIAVASRFPSLNLKAPKIFSSPARAVLGLTVGSAFNPEMVHHLGDFVSSLVLIFPFVIIVTACGLAYYWKLLGFDKSTAYFSAMPGGLLEMVTLAEAFGANLYRVTLAQSARLLFIVFTLPFIIQSLSHIPLDTRNGIMPSIVSLSFFDMGVMALSAYVGWWIGVKFKLPGGAMLGPMVVGAFVYGSGIITSRPPTEVIRLIQLILGTTVGFVFIGVAMKEVIKVFFHTLGYFLILVCVAGSFIWVVSSMTNVPIISIMLAFSPGGQSEMNLMAIIVGANLPFVALHHIVRLFLVMGVAPLLLRLISRGQR